jgi:hypothetical protein
MSAQPIGDKEAGAENESAEQYYAARVNFDVDSIRQRLHTTSECTFVIPKMKRLTPGITRRPARLLVDESQRVGGRVHAVVRSRGRE